MKKYIYLKEGDIIQEGDEQKGLHGWLSLDMEDYGGTKVRYSEEKMEAFRRPVPHTGDVQFLMAVSILVPVIVNCDGLVQDEIEMIAGDAVIHKIKGEIDSYICHENIDWGGSMVDEVQPEPKNPGKYRMLEVGESCSPGDEMEVYGEWIPVHEYHTSSEDPYIINTLSGRFRRPITEPQYRPFKEGDVIEEGDHFRWSESSPWQPCKVMVGDNTHGIIGNPDFRKLIK